MKGCRKDAQSKCEESQLNFVTYGTISASQCDFLLSTQWFCFQAQSPGQPPPPLLKRCAAVLDPLTKSVPGLLEGLYLMAKVKYLSGNKVLAR